MDEKNDEIAHLGILAKMAKMRLAQVAQEAREYAENVVDTVREPLLVLSTDLKILSARRSFYEFFQVGREETIGRFLYDLGNKQWNIPELRKLLEEILPQKTSLHGFEVTHDFQVIGRRTLPPLPRTWRKRQRRGRKPAPLRWRGRGTLLLADDEEMVRDVAREMLEGLGFSVLTVADGREALDLYRERGEEISVVVLDTTMPRMDGEETFRELRRLNPGLPVILSSGYAGQDVVSRFREMAPNGFIQKPYTVDHLQATLARVMSGLFDPGSSFSAAK